MPPKTDMMVSGMPGAGPGMGPGAGPEKEKPSLSKVKDLLQQAMDMLALLGAEDEAEGEGISPAPTPEPRPPLRTTAGL